MTGFNKFYLFSLLLGSILLTGCIPQAKKTECGSNEAFNSSLRACVPVTPGQDEFISISNPIPSTPTTVTATSAIPITLSMNIKNPYARAYRMRWIRNFNGVQSTLYSATAPSASIGDHPYAISITPSSDLLGQVGNHVVTAQILDSSLSLIDSHDFNFTLTNNPTPYGNGFTPTLSVPVSMSPAPASSQSFTLTVYQNGATLSSPQVRWSLNKLTGTPLTPRTQVDTLTFGTPTTGAPRTFTINSANPMNAGSPPTAPFNDIVGTYRLSASIEDGVTTFTTYTWDITIAHPTLGFVDDATLPTPAVTGNTVTAFNGIDYSNITLPNFSYLGGANRAEMCVRVNDADGRYGGGVNVRYYLGSSTAPIYTGTTNAGDDTVCLEDASTAVKATVAFTDPDPDLSWSTSIRARVFDVDTGEEYSSYPSGSYPPVWAFQVKPQNSKPTVAFEDISGTTVACTSSNAANTIKYGCAVTQSNATVNNSFVVAFRVTDDFYVFPTDDDKLSYSAILSRSGTTIDSTSCVKTLSDFGSDNDDLTTNIDDFIGPVYRCRFNMPSQDASGSINPTMDTYSVTLTVTDDGSPFTTTDKSSVLTWNFDVKELNTAPAASATISMNASPYTTITAATEGDTIAFNTTFSDPERDPYRMELRRCLDGAPCTSLSSPLVSSTTAYYTDADYGSPTPNRRVVYTIPDGFVADLATATTVHFQLKAIDMASTATAVNGSNVVTVNNTVDMVLALDISNLNPAPVFANVNAIDTNTVAPGIDYNVIPSFPLTLDPGTVTDASSPGNSAEANITYQWLISADNGTSWTNIADGTSRVLKWTPGQDIVSGNYQIIACATDGSPLRPNALTPNAAGSNCNNQAIVKVERNIALSDLPASATGKTVLGQPAIWVDDSTLGTIATRPNSKVVYTAFPVDNGASNVSIIVNKYYYNSDNEGQMDFIESLEFDALDGASTPTVLDLSMVGDSSNLYIGYRAYIGVAPATYRPQIRRIVKHFDQAASPGSKTGYSHPAPFDFSYTGFTVDTNPACAAPGCWDAGSNGYTVTDGSAVLNVGALFTANPAPQIILNGVAINTIGGDAQLLAQDIENKINSHVHFATKGIIAKATLAGISSTVLITGPIADEHLEIQNNSSHLGELFISGGSLFIPYINDSLPSPNTGKVTVASYPVNTLLFGGVPAEDNLTSFDAATYLTNVMDRSGNLLLGIISASTPGQARVIKFSGVDFTTGVQHTILSAKNITRLEIASDVTGNDNYYAVGRSTTGNHWVTRFPNNMTSFTVMYRMEDTIDVPSANVLTSYINYDFQIAAARPKSPATSISEARITFLTDNGLYAFRTRVADYVTCGACQPISLGDYPAIFDPSARTLSSSAVLSNVTIGTGGNSSAENARNIMLFGYLGDDGSPPPGNQRFNLGLINADVELIQSTTLDTTDGLYSPAVFK